MEDIIPCQKCSHCCQIGDNWLWRLVEVYPEYRYEIRCAECCAQQDRQFTSENAVLMAIIIVGIHAGKLNAKVQR